jgi:NTP pyrophosphatase (non-canonical NTP hydrolase)
MDDTQGEIHELQARILRFRDERNWAQFHTPKDIAMCLSVEAGELLELFLWKGEKNPDLDRVREELADVLYAALLLASHYGIDVRKAVIDKLAHNATKYPVETSWGDATKYSEK